MDSSSQCSVAMEERGVSKELEGYFNSSANGSRTDNERGGSPIEDYDPLKDCT